MTIDPAPVSPPIAGQSAVDRRLPELIARTLKLPPDSIGEHSDIHNTRRWDSLRHVLLMTEIELSYGIELSDAELSAAISVAKIREILRDHGHSWR